MNPNNSQPSNPLVVDQALDYSSKVAYHPSYKPSRVYPQSGGGSSVSLSSSTSETQFEVVSRCLNLSKSTLDFTVTVAAEASIVNAINTIGCPFIDSIALLSREGVELCRIPNLPVYLKMVLPCVTKMEDFLTYDASLGSTTDILANVADKGRSFFRNNAVVSATAGAGGIANGARIRSLPTVDSFEAATNSYTEPQYFRQSTANTASVCNYSIPLRDLAPHTIMSLDKDIFFTQNLILRVTWSPLRQVGFAYTAASAPATGAKDIAAVTVSNMQLLVAVEQQPDIINELVSKMSTTPTTIRIPYVTGNLFAPGAATSSSHQQRYNISHGSKLLCIYSAVASTGALALSYLDISNKKSTVDGVNMAKVNIFNPTMNSINLNDYPINELQSQGYELMKPILKGSVVQNNDQYNANRVYITSFRNGPSCTWLDQDGNDDGVSLLGAEQNYVIDYQTTISAAFREFQYAVTSRMLTISPSGLISIV